MLLMLGCNNLNQNILKCQNSLNIQIYHCNQRYQNNLNSLKYQRILNNQIHQNIQRCQRILNNRRYQNNLNSLIDLNIPNILIHQNNLIHQSIQKYQNNLSSPRNWILIYHLVMPFNAFIIVLYGIYA